MQANFFQQLSPIREKFVSKRCFLGFCSLLALAACQPENGALPSGVAAVQRADIYRQLNQLEQQLPASIDTSIYGVPTGNVRVWLRTNTVPGPSEFENTRVRRIIALEELSDFQIPERDAPDFAAFWEIHGAYRRAAEVSRFGHGITGLIYSRPYPLDHLSGPQLDAFMLINEITIATDDLDAAALLSLLPELAAHIRNAHRRLEFDAVAGIAPPPSVLTAILTSIDASPYASDLRFAEWRAAWDLAAPEDMPRSDWLVQLADDVELVILPEMLRLKEALQTSLDDWNSSAPPSTMSTEYYNALIGQATSGMATAEDCFSNAQRLGLQAEDDFRYVMEARWNDHFQPDETGNVVTDRVAIPDNPLTALMIWQRRAELAPPPPAPPPLIDEATGEPIEPAEPETLLPEAFVSFQNALMHLRSYLAAYSVQRLPGYELTPVIPEVDARTPAPVPPVLFTEPDLGQISGSVPLEVSVAYLETHPMALSVTDILQTYYPGHAYRQSKMERREDVPELARILSTPAFDLGWPYYALSVLSDRHAFDDAPQLEAAMLYRRMEAFTEAEAEAALLTGQWTRDEAVSFLTSRLGITERDARSRLQTYMVEPGVGCAITEGYLTFNTLRERAQGVLGNRLNIREFHDVVLSPGSRPLQIVERDVDSWIAGQVN